MRKFRLLAPFFIAITFITISCTKEGPEGPAGANGAQGPAGAPGTPGQNGAGITIYSPWFSLAAASWGDSLNVGLFGDISRAIKPVAGLTQTIFDQGVILTYTNLGGVQLLPLNIPNPFFANETLQLGSIASVGKLTFYLADLIFPDATGVNYTGPLRYILISGSVSGRNTEWKSAVGGFTKNQLQAMSYEEVLSAFNIPAEGTNIQ